MTVSLLQSSTYRILKSWPFALQLIQSFVMFLTDMLISIVSSSRTSKENLIPLRLPPEGQSSAKFRAKSSRVAAPVG